MHKSSFATEKSSLRFFEFITLLIPVILVVYSALIQWGLVNATHAISNEIILFFSFCWLLTSGLQILVPSKSRLESKLRLLIYHLLTGSYLVFIAGINSPFIVCWIVLMILSQEESAKNGAKISLLLLAAFILLDSFVYSGFSSTIIIPDLTTFLAVALSGLSILRLSELHKNTKEELLDSHRREQLQKNRALTIINNLTDAVISVDQKGIIQMYNAASMALLDTNASLNGHFIDDVFPVIGEDNKKTSLFKELKKIKTITKRDDLSHIFSEDDRIRLEVVFSPIHHVYGQSDGKNNDGYVLIMRDITKAKSLEEEKDEFVGVVSHELRTPLTIAEGTISNAQIMLDHPHTTKEMLKDSFNLAHDQVVFLAGMVNDLSTLSRAERGIADDAEYIDVRELAHKLHTKYSEECKEKGLALDLDLSAKLDGVFVSRLYLEEMLQNFITNSMKYTKKGSIKIIIRQKDDIITFAVKDTGIGISKSDQGKIFQKFYRSEDYRTRETGGTGLGLYITAKLAHKIGTKVEVKSRLNFGSTFSFSLPVSKENKPQA